MFCSCRACRRARRDGKVLGTRTLKHLGAKAYRVSAYVSYPKFGKGRTRKEVLSID